MRTLSHVTQLIVSLVIIEQFYKKLKKLPSISLCAKTTHIHTDMRLGSFARSLPLSMALSTINALEVCLFVDLLFVDVGGRRCRIALLSSERCSWLIQRRRERVTVLSSQRCSGLRHVIALATAVSLNPRAKCAG